MRSATCDHPPSRDRCRRDQSLCLAAARVRSTSSDWRYHREYCPCAFRRGLECLSRTGCSEQRLADTPDLHPCQAHLPILLGGSLLSSEEDRSISCRTTHIPRLPYV